MICDNSRDNCGLMICTVADGIFELNGQYPFYKIGNYFYIATFNILIASDTEHYPLKPTEDGFYGILDVNNYAEKARFKVVESHGKWIKHLDEVEIYDYVYECSVCGGKEIGNDDAFCPWCRAKMDKE